MTQQPATATGGPAGGFKVESNAAGRDFVVSVADGSASGKSDDEILSQFPQFLAQGGKLTSQTYVATGAVTGRELLIDKPGQETERVRIFVSHKRLFEVGKEAVAGRGTLIVGVGAVTVDETVALARHAEKVGCDGALILPPYFVKLTDDEIYAHYADVTGRIGLPVML